MLVVDWLSHVNELFINVISITHLLWLQVTFYSEKRFLSVYLLAQTRFPDFGGGIPSVVNKKQFQSVLCLLLTSCSF